MRAKTNVESKSNKNSIIVSEIPYMVNKSELLEEIASLIRDKKIVHEGRISSLKRFKDDAREVAQDFECGIGLEGHDDIKEGDLIELYQIEKVARRLTK